jgi:hypothetical protein
MEEMKLLERSILFSFAEERWGRTKSHTGTCHVFLFSFSPVRAASIACSIPVQIRDSNHLHLHQVQIRSNSPNQDSSE